MRFAILALALVASSAQADILQLKDSGKKIEKVAIAESASVLLGGTTTEMKLIGAGLRTKVVFGTVNVYVGQVFGDQTEKFVKADPLTSTAAMSSVAVRMTFLRDVPSARLVSGFEEGFEKNNVSLSKKPIAEFLEAVDNAGAAAKDSVMNFVLQRTAAGEESLTLETLDGKVKEIKGAGIVRDILSLWLGESADDGIAKLKESIISGNRGE